MTENAQRELLQAYLKLQAIAQGAIERHLGDVAEAESDDNIYEEAYTIAFDALHDFGVDDHTAGEIASELAQRLAQP